jgi:hypothetical protein
MTTAITVITVIITLTITIKALIFPAHIQAVDSVGDTGDTGDTGEITAGDISVVKVTIQHIQIFVK